MKHNGFEVKISDMLKSKVTDTISFEQKMISGLPNLSPDGVTGSITLQSLGKDSIFASIEDLECVMQETCDRCGASFERKVHIHQANAKYVAQIDESEDQEDEILLIDMKNGVIDLEEFIVHAILLEEPIVKLCPDCLAARQTTSDDEDEEIEEFM